MMGKSKQEAVSVLGNGHIIQKWRMIYYDEVESDALWELDFDMKK